MKRKNVVITLAACLLASVVTIGGTVAWLTDSAKATNHVSIGNVDISVEEPHWNPDEGKDIYPGKVIAKDPQVTNIGKNPCYVRMKIVMDSALTSYITFDNNKKDWFYDEEDGYYYYKKVLAKEKTTEALFTNFKLSESYKEPAKDVNFDIDVYAEAIQSQGFEAKDTSDKAFKNAIKKAFEEYKK